MNVFRVESVRRGLSVSLFGTAARHARLGWQSASGEAAERPPGCFKHAASSLATELEAVRVYASGPASNYLSVIRAALTPCVVRKNESDLH